jgi:signal transduction histidine kinase
MTRRAPSRLLAAVAIAFLVPGWAWTTASAQTRASRTVLTIHWGPENFPGTSILDAAIREALPSHGNAPVNHYAEYLESEDFPSDTASLTLRDYIRRKFEGRRIDVVIANTTPALQFALRHREELFPDVPIVFVAGSIRGTIHRTVPGVTGVLSDVAFTETLELALKLHPSVHRVFVVAQAPTVAGYDDRVQAALRPLSRRVELTYIREQSLAGLLAAVKTVPAESLILYTRYTPEEPHSVVYTDEVARLMAEVSAAPIYAAADVYMGTGVVGGMMRGSRATGARVGEIARQILDGTRPASIPVGTVQLVPTFDWRQLQRWHIDPSRLPPGSEVRFRVPTAWESYRAYILGTAMVVVAQLLLIAGLLTQRARRRRAEKAIQASEATLRTSYERIRHLAGRLINAQEAARASIARELHDGVCQDLAGVSATVSRLKRSSGDIQDAETQRAFAKLEDETLGLFEGIRRVSHDLHPATLRLLGVAAALKAHCREVAVRHAVQVNFRTDGDLGLLHPEVAVCLFRIAQESLRNGVAHGGARCLFVSLERSGEHVELTVADDGQGFDLEGVHRNGSGLGLVSIEERARVIGGNVQVVTAPGKGTTIRVRAPAGAEGSPAVAFGS